MADMEKVIKGLREMSCMTTWKDIDRIRHKFQPIINDATTMLKEQEDKDRMYHALEDDWKRLKDLLKEQDSEKKRIMKVIWDALHEGFSIDTIADQDWVYEQIRHRIEDI